MKLRYLLLAGCLLISACSADAETNTNPQDNQARQKAEDIPKQEHTREEIHMGSKTSWKAEYDAVGMFREDMALYKSNDDGKTWSLVTSSQQPDNTLPGGAKTGFMFKDDRIGWIATHSPAEGTADLYASEDGGQSWSKVPLEVPTRFMQSIITTSVPYFFNEDLGAVVARSDGDSAQHLFYLTLDGGRTWKAYFGAEQGDAGKIRWSVTKTDTFFRYKIAIGDDQWEFSGTDWFKIS